MSADALLSRLDGVKRTGSGRWICKCPAHEDRRPSLSVRELDDGRILIHDFGGCDAKSILDAVGLKLADLYPEQLDQLMPAARDRRHWHAAREALRVLKLECLVVAIGAENLAAGVALSDEDRDRLVLAAGRIRAAAELVA